MLCAVKYVVDDGYWTIRCSLTDHSTMHKPQS